MNEYISRLMDSSLDGAERSRLLGAMATDPELRRTWQRYHLIGAAMRNELGRAVDPALAGRIAACIGEEGGNARTGRLLPFMRRSIPRQAASLALAASVAALAIFTLVPPQEAPGPAPQAVAGGADAGARLARAGSTRWETLSPEMESTLNAYLVEHGEFAASPGLNGFTSYARFVSYDSSQ